MRCDNASRRHFRQNHLKILAVVLLVGVYEHKIKRPFELENLFQRICKSGVDQPINSGRFEIVLCQRVAALVDFERDELTGLPQSKC